MQTIPGQDDVEIRGDKGVRAWVLVQACRAHVQHEHNYDHWTRCTAGAVLVSVFPDGKPVRLEAKRLASGKWSPSRSVLIKAGLKHVVKPLEDGSRYECAFKHRDGQGNTVEVYQCGLVDDARCYR